MKRHIHKITRILIMFCFVAFVLPACEGSDEEIFDNIILEAEQKTDEEDEKKMKPTVGSEVSSSTPKN